MTKTQENPARTARYTLRVRERFEAAHALHSYEGSPEVLHGHSWQVVAELATDQLGDEGMAYDFVAVRRALRALVERFDHQNINRVEPFDRLSPTTEHLARWFFDALHEALPDAPLVSMTVWEGPDCSATYALVD